MSPKEGPSREPTHPGVWALSVLAHRWTAAILEALGDGALRMTGLERVLASAAHGTVSERVRELADAEIVVAERIRRGAARVQWRLTERGRELLEIVGDAAVLERELACPPGDGVVGERIVRSLADPHVRAIRRALVDGPLSLAEIERSALGLTHSTLLRRVSRLVPEGLLTRRGEPGRMRYALDDEHRRLVRVPLLAARCERRWAGPDRQSPSDVRGLVHMIAPIAVASPGVSGALRLHVSGERGEPPIDVSVFRGKLMAHPLAPSVTLAAQGSASALEWGRALLRRDPDRIEAEGDASLLSAVVVALSDAIAV